MTTTPTDTEPTATATDATDDGVTITRTKQPTWPKGRPRLLSAGYRDTPEDLQALAAAAGDLARGNIWYEIRRDAVTGNAELWRDGYGWLDGED